MGRILAGLMALALCGCATPGRVMWWGKSEEERARDARLDYAPAETLIGRSGE